MFIPIEEYKKIVGLVPVLCVDVLIEWNGKYLLVKRNNPPLAGTYWPLGGRVLRGETLVAAAVRKVLTETGLVIDSKNLEFVGCYEDQYSDNMFDLDFLHTVSAVFKVQLKDQPTEIKLDDQSADFIWSVELPERLKITKTALLLG